MNDARTSDGAHAESMDEAHSQPQFIGRLALILAALAVLFGLATIISGLTFHA